MIRLLNVVEGRQECFGSISPGCLASLNHLVDSSGRLLVARCYNDDTGGQVRALSHEVLAQLFDKPAVATDLLEHTEMVAEIGLGKSFEMQMLCNAEPSGLIVATHIPVRWN